MPEPTLYLFDGFNLLHAGGFETRASCATCSPASSPRRAPRASSSSTESGATRPSARSRCAAPTHADPLLEKLAAENRATRNVCVVSSDSAVRGTAGRQVQTLSSQTFLHDLEPTLLDAERPGQLRDRLDPETLARLERMRRGE